jgi:hypothetical protein
LNNDSFNQYDASFRILNWWHDHKESYPVLSILAKDIMNVQFFPSLFLVRVAGCLMTGVEA